jgi:hypothetical protein
MSGATRLHGINVAVGSGCGAGTGVSGRGMLQDESGTPVNKAATGRFRQGDKLRIVMTYSVD